MVHTESLVASHDHVSSLLHNDESHRHIGGARGVEFALAYGTKTLAPARTLASYELHTEARVSIDGRHAARREERLRPPLEM